MEHVVKILSIEHLTHDVLRIEAGKPQGLEYQPGQAVEISINKEGWQQERRPFTFTSLPDDDHIEFSIKTYPSHRGVTNELLSLKPGDEFILHDVFGTILYRGEGVFIAGGAGVTPFIAIFKQLEKDEAIGNNKLIFANKTQADIILEHKFSRLLGRNFVNVLSEETVPAYRHGYISPELLKEYIEDRQFVYLCGPDPMMEAIEKQLAGIGVDSSRIVREAF